MYRDTEQDGRQGVQEPVQKDGQGLQCRGAVDSYVGHLTADDVAGMSLPVCRLLGMLQCGWNCDGMLQKANTLVCKAQRQRRNNTGTNYGSYLRGCGIAQDQSDEQKMWPPQNLQQKCSVRCFIRMSPISLMSQRGRMGALHEVPAIDPMMQGADGCCSRAQSWLPTPSLWEDLCQRGQLTRVTEKRMFDGVLWT